MSLGKIIRSSALVAVLLLAFSATSALLYRAHGRRAIALDRALAGPGAVDSLERVAIGGIDQWIEVRGESVDNPVLLFLHGGPGAAMMPVARAFQGPWERHFTVVQWDQRGAGKTCTTSDRQRQWDSLTLARMDADVLEMVEHLCRRSGRGRIVVLGHSWGSILGLRLAHAHPELLYAYVGVGQATDGWENEVVLYRTTLEQARRAGNDEAERELAALAPYPSPGITLPQVMIVRKWAGVLIGPAGTDESWQGPRAVLLAPEYSLANAVDWYRGQIRSAEVLLPEMARVDLDDLGTDYRVPVFFLEGRHDPYTPATIAEAFFARIVSPVKEFVWFEASGHFPFAEEPEAFTAVLVGDVLPLCDRAPAPDSGRGCPAPD